MKMQDFNALKGRMKTAAEQWMHAKIDELLPNKSAVRVLAKNGLSNVLDRFDSQLNYYLDCLFLLVADKNKTIDSDAMVDLFADLLDEMEVTRYDAGIVGLTIGGGEICIELPKNILFDMLVGNMGKIRFNKDDIKELKNFLK